jgi:hypothetical protein
MISDLRIDYQGEKAAEYKIQEIRKLVKNVPAKTSGCGLKE